MLERCALAVTGASPLPQGESFHYLYVAILELMIMMIMIMIYGDDDVLRLSHFPGILPVSSQNRLKHELSGLGLNLSHLVSPDQNPASLNWFVGSVYFAQEGIFFAVFEYCSENIMILFFQTTTFSLLGYLLLVCQQF